LSSLTAANLSSNFPAKPIMFLLRDSLNVSFLFVASFPSFHCLFFSFIPFTDISFSVSMVIKLSLSRPLRSLLWHSFNYDNSRATSVQRLCSSRNSIHGKRLV
jgi:hypothetical protein